MGFQLIIIFHRISKSQIVGSILAKFLEVYSQTVASNGTQNSDTQSTPVWDFLLCLIPHDMFLTIASDCSAALIAFVLSILFPLFC